MNFNMALVCFAATVSISTIVSTHPLTKVKTVAVAAAAVGAKLGYKAGAHVHHDAHHVLHHDAHHVEHAVHVVAAPVAHVHAEPLHHHHVHYAPVVHHVEHDLEPIIGKPTEPLVNVNDVVALLHAGKRIVKQKAIGLLSAINPVGIAQRVAHVVKGAIESKRYGVVHEHVVEHVPVAHAHVTNHVEYAPVPVSVW